MTSERPSIGRSRVHPRTLPTVLLTSLWELELTTDGGQSVSYARIGSESGTERDGVKNRV